jgi:hypothetical protein
MINIEYTNSKLYNTNGKLNRIQMENMEYKLKISNTMKNYTIQKEIIEYKLKIIQLQMKNYIIQMKKIIQYKWKSIEYGIKMENYTIQKEIIEYKW